MDDSADKLVSAYESEIRYYKNQVNELASSVLKLQFTNSEFSIAALQMKRGLALISDLKKFDSSHANLAEVYSHFIEYILLNMLMDYALVLEINENQESSVVTLKGFPKDVTISLLGKNINFPEEYLVNPYPVIITSESEMSGWIEEFRSQLFLEYFILTPVYHEERAFAFLITGRRTEQKQLAYSKLTLPDLNVLEAIAAIISTIKNHLEQTIILENKVNERTLQLKLEKEKSDNLLLNILPGEVAEELKLKGSADARQFEQVTVMFTDFKGFTQISEKMSAAELVAEIHSCFKAFDEIITRYNIEKIKTIGDSYMCAGGLPLTNTTHAQDVVSAALEIQDFIKHRQESNINEGKEIFEIRIGIHTGPVVAGIVGVKKFAYDIWGDTVNTASRMESSGEAGKVNISGSTYELVKDLFKCIYRGKVEAKNKGAVDMYFVENQ